MTPFRTVEQMQARIAELEAALKPIPRKKCKNCGCLLGRWLGELEYHKSDCPQLPL